MNVCSWGGRPFLRIQPFLVVSVEGVLPDSKEYADPQTSYAKSGDRRIGSVGKELGN